MTVDEAIAHLSVLPSFPKNIRAWLRWYPAQCLYEEFQEDRQNLESLMRGYLAAGFSQESPTWEAYTVVYKELCKADAAINGVAPDTGALIDS
jgi:hypothetical protein